MSGCLSGSRTWRWCLKPTSNHLVFSRVIPYGSEYQGLWFPIYLHCRFPGLTDTACFFALPPSRIAEVLLVRADADPRTDAHVRALVDVDRPAVETLLAYLDNGAIEAARRVAPDVVTDAVQILETKRDDPLGVVVAGYFLLLAGRLERQSWFRNLADWFPAFPDAAVVYGASLLKGHDAPERRADARSYLLAAVERGIPAYTVGLRLLFDGLRRLAAKADDNADTVLKDAPAKVRFVAAYADWEARTTSFAMPPLDKDAPLRVPNLPTLVLPLSAPQGVPSRASS